MNLQRFRPYQQWIFWLCLMWAVPGVAHAMQGVFTCTLDGESSQIELALPGVHQQLPVRGHLRFEMEGSKAKIFELGFTTSPVLFRGQTTELEFALDPSSTAVVQPSPFMSSFWV